jgi:succinate dehydrogenase / fumarate reductase iron-sulfur subunit
MEITFDILRRRSPEDKPYTQTVTIDADAVTTVAEALEQINASALSDDPVQWDRSCKQKRCGACAMLINDRPQLACGVKLGEFSGRIKLAPLAKFPCVRDLIVDRSVIFDSLRELGSWLDDNAEAARTEDAYDASRCLQCGCCLEVCPNFYAGGKFYGASALTAASRIISETGKKSGKRLYKSYDKHFYSGCGKSFSCKNVCPAGIDTERLMVNSNAAAIWKRSLINNR